MINAEDAKFLVDVNRVSKSVEKLWDELRKAIQTGKKREWKPSGCYWQHHCCHKVRETFQASAEKMGFVVEQRGHYHSKTINGRWRSILVFDENQAWSFTVKW